MAQKYKHFYHVTPSKTDHRWRVKEVGSKDTPNIYVHKGKLLMKLKS